MNNPAAPDFALPAGLLETALSQAYNAIVLTDADLGAGGCKILYCNPAFCRMTGYTAAELMGQTPRILQGPLTDPAVLLRLRGCLAAGRGFEGRAINYRKGGSTYHVEWKISPVYNDLGQVTHYISIQQDITQLLQAQEMQALLGMALDAAPSSVFITDAQQRVMYANRAFAALSGYAQADILGKKPGQLLHSGVHDADFYQSLQSSLERGQTFKAAFTNRRKDGSLYHCEQSVAALHDAAGQTTHYVSVATDVGHFVAREQALQNLACRDPLTSLLNRRAGEEALQRCHAAAQASGQAYAVIMADIDRFKRVNDLHGHAAGDRIIAAAAQQLSHSVRNTDAVVRWGGEEFLIALPGLGLPAALELAERIRLAVADCHDAEVGRVTLSLGVAAGPAGGTEIDTVKRADQALYAAKQQGRNRVVADCAAPDGRPGNISGPASPT